jgi:hypothetical protein
VGVACCAGPQIRHETAPEDAAPPPAIGPVVSRPPPPAAAPAPEAQAEAPPEVAAINALAAATGRTAIDCPPLRNGEGFTHPPAAICLTSAFVRCAV